MNITKLEIGGAYYIEAKRHADERGWFQEWFKKSELQKQIDFDFTPVQANISRSSKGVIRGIHYSIAPEGQAKLVTVMNGAIDDYVIDINPKSNNFGKWVRVHLTAQDGNAILLPPHVGHAFQALTDNTTVCYLVTAEFNPEAEKGISPFCERLNISWEQSLVSITSAKDIHAPDIETLRRNGLLPELATDQSRLSYAELDWESESPVDLRYQIMIERDQSIGLSAENRELVHRMTEMKKRHEIEIKSIKNSWTWRIGYWAMSPIRLIKRQSLTSK